MLFTYALFIAAALVLTAITSWHMVAVHGAKAINYDKDILHDYVLNFIGTLLGWTSLFYLIFYRWGQSLTITDLLLIFIVFVGVTGYLPHIIINKGFKP